MRGIVEKSEAGYTKVQTDLVLMRRAGDLPYQWLADNTRWQRKPRSFESVADALKQTAQFYRKALWADADAYVEIWLEKDALSGVILPVTAEFDVPLMVARGYASLSFLHSAAEYINELVVPTHVYHLGDFDPSGVNAGEKIEETLQEPGAGCRNLFRTNRSHARTDRRMESADATDQDQRHTRQGLWKYFRRTRCDRT